MATTNELKELSVADLGRRAGELRETLFRDQLKRKTGSLDNPSGRTLRRRELAAVLTELTVKTKAEGK